MPCLRKLRGHEHAEESPVERSFDSRSGRSRATRAAWSGCLALVALLAFGPTPPWRTRPSPRPAAIVRFSDIGWTDVTATTGLASHLVRMLGYQPAVTVLSVPVTYASLKNSDIDVFLGNWMPAQAADLQPYQADGSVEVIGANLDGAKYTLAVPAYLYEAGCATSPTSSASRTELEARDLRHRARQRRQPPRADDDQGEPVRARRLQARRVERAGHARAGRARGRREAAHRVLRLGAAPDEHALRHALPHRRRRELRARTTAARRSTRTSAPATCRNARTSGAWCGTSSSRCAARARSWPASSSASSRPRLRPRNGCKANPDALDGLVRRRDDIRRRARAARRTRRPPRRRRAARGFEAWVTAHKIPLGRAVETAHRLHQGPRQGLLRRRLDRDPGLGGRRERGARGDPGHRADPRWSRRSPGCCIARSRSSCSSSRRSCSS